MAEERKTMMEPPIEELLSKVDSKFTLVTVAAKRGRQINAYFSQLGEGLGSIVPPQVTSVSRKPLSIALEEVAAGKIVSVKLDPAAQAAEATAAVTQAPAGTSTTPDGEGAA